MVLNQECARSFRFEKPSEHAHVIPPKIIYANKTICEISFLQNDVTGTITFKILNLNMSLTIFNLIFRSLYRTSILEARNTLHRI